MYNIFIFAGIISIIFLIIKFIEMRMIDKEPKPLKFLIRDSLLVYFCVIVGDFITLQLKPFIEEDMNILKATSVFTDNPGF